MSSSALGVAPKTVFAEAERRAMVAERMPPGEASFVYGVRSTRIYCRSDCPSRRPAPGQLVFFDSPREAVAAGYRACRRCRPDQGLDYAPQLRAVERACRWLEATPGGPWSLVDLSARVGYSPYHFQRVFSELLGVSPKQYLEAARARRFRDELRRGRSVRSATYAAGHRSLSWPYARAARASGMDAGEYRRGGAEQVVEHAIVASPLGPLLVAATARGICSVQFGSSEESLLGRLAEEFPQADLRSTRSPQLRRWSRVIVDSLANGRLPITELPLDIRATTFQARVWNAIRAIAPGRTRTYAEIAREIGSVGGARAVARACAANPAALLVPCHRVVRSDGALGGYRWGLERKRRLLEGERAP